MQQAAKPIAASLGDLLWETAWVSLTGRAETTTAQSKWFEIKKS